MNWNGLIVATGTFLLIGVFHVVVIKSEFYFGKESWFVFAGAGTIASDNLKLTTKPHTFGRNLRTKSLREIAVDKPVNLFVERVFQECFCLRF